MEGLPLSPLVNLYKKQILFLHLFISLSRMTIHKKASFVTPSLSYTHHHFLQRVFILYIFAFFL